MIFLSFPTFAGFLAGESGSNLKKVNEKGQSPLAENAKSAAERLGGLEVGFLGMTPQNFKIVGITLKKGAKSDEYWNETRVSSSRWA